MRDIANRLERMCCINRDIRLAQALVGHDSDRLLAMRADFAFESSQLFNQLTAALNCNGKGQTASRMLDAFVALLNILRQHQQAWSVDAVASDPQGYLAEARKVHATVINFLEDALEVIETATRQAGEQLAARRPIAQSDAIRLTGTR